MQNKQELYCDDETLLYDFKFETTNVTVTLEKKTTAYAKTLNTLSQYNFAVAIKQI
jgi:hypothetical protein